jgi:DNA-binding response OmpR family regulator
MTELKPVTTRKMNPVTKNSSQRVLIVDDEADTVELIEFNLKNSGYQTATASGGAEALRKVRSMNPDLIILDLMLPEIDGLQVCKLLRNDPATANIPVLMLTAKATEVDRVLGLELGARDYVTKPFSPRELILRVRNLLAAEDGEHDKPQTFRLGELFIDVPRHIVTVEQRRVELTATEFRLLTVLAERRGRVQSREQLLQDVWHYDNIIDTRTVDTHIRRLREKLGKAARFLDTVRGVGYRFVQD